MTPRQQWERSRRQALEGAQGSAARHRAAGRAPSSSRRCRALQSVTDERAEQVDFVYPGWFSAGTVLYSSPVRGRGGGGAGVGWGGWGVHTLWPRLVGVAPTAPAHGVSPPESAPACPRAPAQETARRLEGAGGWEGLAGVPICVVASAYSTEQLVNQVRGGLPGCQGPP